MDRNTLSRWILIAAIAVGGYFLFYGKKSGDGGQQLPFERYVNAPGFAPDIVDSLPAPPPPPEGALCTLHGDRFDAELSSRGASLTHLYLTDSRYAEGDSRDVTTTHDIERWRNLRTLFRAPGVAPAPSDQIAYDRFSWSLDASAPAGSTCRFTYEDATVRVVKTVTVAQRPFELDVDTTLTNLADGPRKHSTSVEVFALRTNKEVKGKLGRVSPFVTGLECARGDDVKRLGKDASEFKVGWFSFPLDDRYAAIANYYFAQTLVPLDVGSGDKPSSDFLAGQRYGPAPE